MPAAKKERGSDPYKIEERLEKQIHLHLQDMENEPQMFASKDRLQAIQVIGMFLNRKYGWVDGEYADAGSAVRKYASAFRTPPHVRPSRVSGGAEADDS